MLHLNGNPLADGATLSTPGTLSVAASDPSGVAGVEFLINGRAAGSDQAGSGGVYEA